MNPRRRSVLLGVAGAVLLGACTSAGGTALPEDEVSITTAATSSTAPTTTARQPTTTTIPATTTTTTPVVLVSSLAGSWQSPTVPEAAEPDAEEPAFTALATAAETIEDQWDEFGFEWTDVSGETHSFVITEPMEISGLPTLEVFAAGVAIGRATIDGESNFAKALVSIAPTEIGTLLVSGELFADPPIPFSFELAPQP